MMIVICTLLFSKLDSDVRKDVLNAAGRDSFGFTHYKALLIAYHYGYITCLWRYLLGLYLLGNVDFQIPRGGAVSL